MSQIRKYHSLAEMSAAAAEAIAELSRSAILKRGRFTLALSGGETPRTLYALLAENYRSKIDWQHVHLFWGDERYVSHDDPASNFRMAQETLLSVLDIPPENIHAIPTSFPDPGAAADSYARELTNFFGAPNPAFDVILVGLGSDGHTASIFPSTPIEATRDGLVIVTESPILPITRISLTMNVLDAARNAFFLVSGVGKEKILSEVLAEEGNPNSRYPSARAQPKGDLVWFVSR